MPNAVESGAARGADHGPPSWIAGMGGRLRLQPAGPALVSGMPVKTSVVRSTVSAATPVRPIVAIIFIRRDLQALPKRKADKSRKDDQGEKRSYPIRHHLLQRGTIIPQ
jgi:hypothetical protein